MKTSATLLRMLAALGAALAAVIIAFAPPAQAQTQASGKSQDKAMMLVAKPTLAAAYSQTVLLVVPLGESNEHVGFILNRPLEQTLATIFPDHAPAQKVVDPVRFGGPVMVDTLFALVKSQSAPAGESQRIAGDLFIASRATDIDKIIEQQPNDARYFVGFVGWRPGELDAEIAKGFWYVIDPQPELVFRKDMRTVWRELVHRLGVDPDPRQRAL